MAKLIRYPLPLFRAKRNTGSRIYLPPPVGGGAGIAFRAAATPSNGTASPATVTAPAGRAVNDVLLVSVSQDSASTTLTTPTGWTLVDGPTASSTQQTYSYARIADGTSTDNFSATISGATNWLCNMLAYSGCDTSGAVLTTAIKAHGVNFDASAVTAMTTPSLTTPALAGCVLVGMFTADAVSTLHSYSPTSTSPSVGTPTERYDNNEGNGFLCSCGDDTVGLALTASTAYTMTVTCNGAEVGTHYGFILAPASGGQLFTQSLSGALSFTGSQIKLVSNGERGALSFVGAQTKLISSGRTGSLSFIGILTKRTSTSRTGSLSFVGNLATAAVHHFTQALTGSLSFVGNLFKRANAAKAGSLSFVGAQSRFIGDTETGSLTLNGAVTKLTGTGRTGSLTFSGALTKRTARALSGSVSFVGNLATAVVHFFTQAVSGSLSFVGAITKRTSTGRTGSVSFIGAQARSVGYHLTGALSFVGNLATAGAGHFFQSLTGSLSFVGAQTRRVASGKTGSVSFVGAQSRLIGDTETGSLTLNGAVTKRTATTRTGSVSFVGNLATAVVHFFTQALSGAVSFIGTRTARQTFAKALAGSLSFTGAQSRRTVHTMSSAASFTGTILRRIPARLTAALSFVGSVVGIPSGALQPKPPFSLANQETASAMTAMTATGGDTNVETVRAGLSASTAPATAPTGTEAGRSSMTTTTTP